MSVALMADVPDKAVLRKIKTAVHCDGQLDNTEVWRKMAAVYRDNLNELFADFGAKRGHVLALYLFDVLR